MKELKFFVCTHCGNLAGMVYNSGVPMICCGEPMKELVPNTVDAAGEKHKPVISVDGSTVTVTVGSVAHPMTEAHLIQWVVLQTEQGVQRKELAPPRPVEDRAVSQPAEDKPKYHRGARASGRFFVAPLSGASRQLSPRESQVYARE